MRPYFAPRLQPAPARPATPATPAEIAAAWTALAEATRPHWPGGQPTQADLAGMEKRICNRLSATPQDISAALLLNAPLTPR